MLDGYICKKATIEDMEQNWNYLIEIHPDNNAWKIWKEKAIKDMEKGNAIVYYGILNGVIISEATAFLSNLDVQNSDGLVNDTTAYLSAFRTREEYLGKIDLIGKRAFELQLNDIYEINFLNREDQKNEKIMYKTIKEAKKNIQQILEEENNDDIISSHESIIEEYKDNL